MFEARRYGSEHAPSANQIALLFDVAALGAGVYYAYTRQRDLYGDVSLGRT